MTAELKVREELLAPNGYLHAATVVALADTMCGYGCMRTCRKAQRVSPPSNWKSNHLAPRSTAPSGSEARPQHLGRTTQVWDATVRHRETGKTITVPLYADGVVAVGS